MVEYRFKDPFMWVCMFEVGDTILIEVLDDGELTGSEIVLTPPLRSWELAWSWRCQFNLLLSLIMNLRDIVINA